MAFSFVCRLQSPIGERIGFLYFILNIVGQVTEEIYKKIRAKFITLLVSEAIADALLQKFWKKTLREMSCNNIVDIMDCFTLL